MATGTSTDPSGRRTPGFTLLELLVALLIIGITLTLLTLKASPRQQGVSEEGRRLAALLNLAREEAILNSGEMALELDSTSYRFSRLTNNAWQPLTDDETFRGRTLPPGLTMRLTMEGQELPLSPLGEGEGKTDPDQEGPARVYLLSSGEVSPFTLTITDPAAGTECLLTVTPADQVQVTLPASPR